MHELPGVDCAAGGVVNVVVVSLHGEGDARMGFRSHDGGSFFGRTAIYSGAVRR